MLLGCLILIEYLDQGIAGRDARAAHDGGVGTGVKAGEQSGFLREVSAHAAAQGGDFAGIAGALPILVELERFPGAVVQGQVGIDYQP